MNIRFIRLSLLLFLCIYSADSQTYTSRLIVKGNKDSALIKADYIVFNKAGDYRLSISKNGKKYIYTNHDTLGPFTFIGGSYMGGGEVQYTYSDLKDHLDSSWYYFNAKGVKIYGPVKGRVVDQYTDDSREDIAVRIKYRDSAFYYINNQLVNSVPLSRAGIETKPYWCTFSANGKVIHYTKKDSLFSIFTNGHLIDRSFFPYDDLQINDDDEYIFSKRTKDQYSGLFTIYTKDTTYGPYRSTGNNHLKENGAYYWRGIDYIIINGKLFTNLDTTGSITLIDRENYLFTGREKSLAKNYDRGKAFVKGKVFDYTFEKIFLPSLDTSGNFAFYGYRDYYLYKYINGKEETKPITKYGVRPYPLYISPTGSSLHVFRTDDSTYIYRDDALIFQPFSNKVKFNIKESWDLFNSSPYSWNRRVKNSHLFYMEIDSIGYMNYNGLFSKPILPIRGITTGYSSKIGDIAAIQLRDEGFFIVQKTGNNKFTININNQFYQNIDGVSDIVSNSCFFDGQELIFYGIKDLSFYQYKIKL